MSLRKSLVRAGVATAMVAAPIGGAVVNAAPAHASAPACTKVVYHRGYPFLRSSAGSSYCTPNLLSVWQVKVVQSELANALGNMDIRVAVGGDGSYGPHTRAMVRLFQQHAHLPVDGIVGPATNVSLNAWGTLR